MKRLLKYFVSLFVILLLTGCELFGEDQKGVIINYNCEGINEYRCVTDNNKLNCIIIIPECKGYSFVGWYDAKSNGNPVNLDADFESNSKIYAVWEEDGSEKPKSTKPSDTTKPSGTTTTVATPVIKKYTVKFDKNGGSGTLPDSINVRYDEMMPSINSNSLTRNGYIFMGWSDNKEYTFGKMYYNEKNEPSKYYDVKKNITLYAGWKKESTSVSTEAPTSTTTAQKKYTVTFNLNKGTGNIPAKVEVKNGDMMPVITSNLPTRNGYVFTGWYDKSDYTKGQAYYNEKNKAAKYFDKKSNMTLYAGWSKDIVVMSYKIIFNANGGSGGQTNSLMIKTGEDLPKITSTAPTRSGYKFLGWYDSVNNGTQYYNSNGSPLVKFTKSENVTLYAHWKANTYKINFNINGGSGSVPSSVTATYGSKVPAINKNKPTRSGYTFMGWYDNTNYSKGKSYYTANNERVLNYNVAKDLTLYAGWSKKSNPTYTVTFNANGGSGGQTSSVTVKKGSSMPNISTTAPTRTGYTFVGWYDALSGGTMYYTNGGKSAKSYDKTSGCTLYARWSAIPYRISYSLNGGTSGSSAPTIANYGSIITINNPSKSFTVSIDNSAGATLSSGSVSINQTFLGWTASSNLNTSTAKYGSTTSTTNYWNVSSNKVTDIYFKNLLSSASTVTLSANWKTSGIKLPTVSKSGYTCGFSTSSNGTITYNSGATYTPSITASSVKLYTICNKTTYVLTYNANGGTVSPTSKNVGYNDAYGTLPTPTRSGYTFKGWYTSASGGTAVSASTKMGSSNVTIYANWQKNGTTLRVATYNAGYFHCGSSSYKCMINGVEVTKEQLRQYVIDIIRQEKIDIIGLQEVRDPWLTPEKNAQSGYIKYIINELKKDGYDGWYVEAGQNYNAIISNKSFTKKLNKTLQSGRKLNGIEFTVNNVKMSFYNTHLGLNDKNPINFSQMLEEVNKDTNPMIITGDFNNNDRSAFNNMLNAGFDFAGYDDSGKNMHESSGLKIAYMDSILVKPLNHIGYNLSDHRVIITNRIYSDHNLVITDLTIY